MKPRPQVTPKNNTLLVEDIDDFATQGTKVRGPSNKPNFADDDDDPMMPASSILAAARAEVNYDAERVRPTGITGDTGL